MIERQVVTPTEARQGSSRQLNLRVLSRSLLIAVVAAVALYAVFYGATTKMSTPDPAPLQTTAPGP